MEALTLSSYKADNVYTPQRNNRDPVTQSSRYNDIPFSHMCVRDRKDAICHKSRATYMRVCCTLLTFL